MGRRGERQRGSYSVATHAAGVSAGDERVARYHDLVGRTTGRRTSKSGTAFLIEALLLLVFLAGSLAVLMQLDADATERGRESENLTCAVVLATNAAEEFTADPVGALSSPAVWRDGDFLVSREVTDDPCESGAMYEATITVWHTEEGGDAAYALKAIESAGEEPVYTLTTTAYRSQAAEAVAEGVVPDVSEAGDEREVA